MINKTHVGMEVKKLAKSIVLTFIPENPGALRQVMHSFQRNFILYSLETVLKLRLQIYPSFFLGNQQ